MPKEDAEKVAPLVKNLPKDVKGDCMACAYWKDGRTLRTIFRTGNDECRNIARLVNFIVAMKSALSGGVSPSALDDDEDDDYDD